MIYINGKQVNFSNRNEDYQFAKVVEEYHDLIREVNERHKGVVRFVAKDAIRIDPLTKQMRPSKPYSFRSMLKLVMNDEPQTWVWSPSAATIKDGVAVSTQPTFQIFRGEASYSTEDEPDFIYFLTKHTAVKSGTFRIDDPAEQASNTAKQRRLESKFKDIIYSENSPLYDDVDKLKMMARKWGVSPVDEMSDDSIRNSLYDTVLNGESKRQRSEQVDGIEAFIEDFEMGDKVKIGAQIQKALDAESLFFDRDTNEWKLSVSTDQSPVSIMKVSSSDIDKRRSSLIDYMDRNRDDFNLLEMVLSGEAVLKYGQVHSNKDVSVPTTVTLDTIKDAAFTDLQKTAKELGLGKQLYGKKKEELRELVKEKLEEVAEGK